MYNLAFNLKYEDLEMKAEIVKVCKKHGELTQDQVTYKKDGAGYKYSICRECGREWQRTGYQNNKEKRLAEAAVYRSQNREKLAEWARNDRRANKEKYSIMYQTDKYYTRKLHQLIRKRGLTVEIYESMIKAQNNLCAICNSPETRKEPNDNQICRLAIDHCHTTNKARGLLCHNCNTGIGKFKDNIQTLESAIAYLRKHAESS